MLDTGHHLLSDIAALLEIDAGKLIHVGFMWEGAAIHEIRAAARYAERDAVRVIGVGANEGSAEMGGSFRREIRRQNRARAERRKARIGIGQPVFAQGRVIPERPPT